MLWLKFWYLQTPTSSLNSLTCWPFPSILVILRSWITASFPCPSCRFPFESFHPLPLHSFAFCSRLHCRHHQFLDCPLSAHYCVEQYKGLRLTAARRPSNDFWLVVWKDGAEILRANPGRAMLNWGRHNVHSLPVWKQSGPMLSAGCAHVGPSRVEPSWAHLGLMLGQVGPMLSHVGPILGLHWPRLGLCWAMLGPSWAHVGPMLRPCWPMLGLCWPMLSHLGSDVGAMFGPSMLKRS